MSHYARVQDDIVNWVIVAEADFIASLPDAGNWFQTSYNTKGGVHLLGGTPFRKNYAGLGFTFDRVRDAFIPPRPFASWILNEDSCLWECPVAYPTDGAMYEWNEAGQAWTIVQIPGN